MSKTVKGFMLMAIAVGFIMIFLTTSGRASRSNENTNALVTAIDDSLKNVMEQNAYEISNSNEFVADFVEALLMQYESDSEITVNILKQDMEKGLLSVEVNEKYKHPNGKEGTVSVQRTVIFDKKEVEKARPCKACFYLSKEDMQSEDSSYENCYKIYDVDAGDEITVPSNPQLEGKIFQCWKNAEGEVIGNAQQIDTDMSFYAVFKDD